MKKITALILALVMLMSFAACGNTQAPAETKAPVAAENPAEENTDPVTIYFCNYAVLETAHTDYWNQLIADFEAKYPYINVEVISAAYNDCLLYTSDAADEL